jgi:UDP-glucose 6-dehydrogenase
VFSLMGVVTIEIVNVGLSNVVCLSHLNHHVMCLDVDSDIILTDLFNMTPACEFGR